MGHRPDEPGARALMAEMLTKSGTDDEINTALSRCAHECRFPVHLPDILQRIPGHEIPQPEAEARKAWDTLTAFVKRYVSNDVYGNYGPEHGWYKNFPRLSDRILDSVRRSGGWKVYACMTDEDFPFTQKRFFEEYKAWQAVEKTDANRMITAGAPLKQITAKVMERPEQESYDTTLAQGVPAKPFPSPTTANIADRREELRQQAATLRNKGARNAS